MKPLSAEKHESGTEARKRLGWPDLTEEQQRKNYEDSGMDYRPYGDSAGVRRYVAPWNFLCWLLGCKVVESYDACPWCTRCGRDSEFMDGLA